MIELRKYVVFTGELLTDRDIGMLIISADLPGCHLHYLV